jgi:protein CMS1
MFAYPPDTNMRQFAKHMKVEEQVQFLEKHKTGICVGTPARLMDLMDNGKFDAVILEDL